MSAVTINISSPSTEFGELRVLGAFVHVSDIHTGHGDATWQADQEMVLTELVRDLTEMARGGLPPVDAILLSGDLGARGGKRADEYRRTRMFVDRLRIAAGLRKRGVILAVPGNHDVIRTVPTEVDAYRLVEDLRAGTKQLDESLVTHADIAVLDRRFSNYDKFVRRIMPRVRGNRLLAWSHDIQLTQGLLVQVIGLNTALLCNDDRDKQKLQLGTIQLQALQGDSSTAGLRIAMMHHPASWLKKEDGVELTGWLSRYAQLHIYDHIHAANISSVRISSGEELVTLVAGAAHSDRKVHRTAARHGYNVVVLFAATDGRVVARVLPRIFFGQKKFRADHDLTKAGTIFAEFPLGGFVGTTKRKTRETSRGGAGKTDKRFTELAMRLIERIGRRRTAFPTDLSVRELAQQDLLVPTPLVNRSTRGKSKREGVAGLLQCTERNENLLILGSPGGGKTVLAYEVALAFSKKDTILPLVVDLRTVEVKSLLSATLGGLVQQLTKDFGGHGKRVSIARERIVIIIDGLDERVAGGETPEALAASLVALARLAPILVTCRAEDYDRSLAAIVPGELFQGIFDIQPWSISNEFRDFIRRLADRSLVDADMITRCIAEDAQLASLVERPLFARMLTYVLGDTAGPPRTRTALYQSYLTKLGKTTDALMLAASCRTAIPAVKYWRTVAAAIFAEHGGGADEMPMARLMMLLDSAGIGADCAYRLLAAIMDIETTRGRLSAAFIHYSFFEFLVAEHLALRLIALFPAQPGEGIRMLVRHIPQEIRRHLVRILAEVMPDKCLWLGWLVQLYEAAGTLSEPDRRTSVNMVAYLICRLQLNAASHLRILLQKETDPFLINSFSWAAARLNDVEATWSWLEKVNTDQSLASLNRGYLLYYLGDLKRPEPPYRDDEPHIDCKNTRRKLFEKLKESDGSRPAARRAVDIFSFLDLLTVRGLKQSQEEALTTQAFLSELSPHVSPSVHHILIDKFQHTT